MPTAPLPRYDRTRSYRWNYEHAPEPAALALPDVPPLSGGWTFCGRPVPSPLGIAAGPLLNGRWLLYYAALGFDVLTYKTVRSGPRECYPLPNLQPVATGPLTGSEDVLPAADAMGGSWAVSFGMPSAEPAVWRADIEQTRGRLPTEKLLSVSVVGTVQPGWTTNDLATDYARCARWAVESGADCIETNFSCPNVATCDGQLYQQPRDAAAVAAAVREAIGGRPLIIKIGHMSALEDIERLVTALAPHADALAMTNSVAARVRSADGSLLFDGQRRGICGDATRGASVAQVRLFAEAIRRQNARLLVIGVGGASTAEHVREYLGAGAAAVHLATAVMVNPAIGAEIRRAWIRSEEVGERGASAP